MVLVPHSLWHEDDYSSPNHSRGLTTHKSAVDEKHILSAKSNTMMMMMNLVVRTLSVWLILAVSFRSTTPSGVSASGVWVWDGTEESCVDVCGCRRSLALKHPTWKLAMVQKCDNSCDCVRINPECPPNPEGKPCEEVNTLCLEYGAKTFKPYYCSEEDIFTDPVATPTPPTPKPTIPPTLRPTYPPAPTVITDKPVPHGSNPF